MAVTTHIFFSEARPTEKSADKGKVEHRAEPEGRISELELEQNGLFWAELKKSIFAQTLL